MAAIAQGGTVGGGSDDAGVRHEVAGDDGVEDHEHGERKGEEERDDEEEEESRPETIR